MSAANVKPLPGTKEFDKARLEFERATAPAEEESPRPIDWPTLKGDPPPRQWFHQDWLGPWPTLLAGSGGVGKTQLAQALCTALTIGKHYVGDTPRALRTLTWSCEDDTTEIWRRQLAINTHFGVDMDDISGRLHIVPRLGHENTLLQLLHGVPTLMPLYDELLEQVNDLRVDLLILDNLAQVFGGNENDRHHVTKFVNALAGLAPDRPFAPILLGHVSRKDGSEFSGNAAWENAVRMRWYLGHQLPDQKPQEGDEEIDTGVVYLARRKANYGAKDWRRLRFTNGMLVPEQPPAGVRFDQAYRDDAANAVVLAGYTKLKEMGITGTDGSTSPDYLPKQILAKKLQQNHTKDDLVKAMNRLIATGKFKRAPVGQYANRSPKMGLVIP